jgi:Cu(I)/Ag(I) efflux system membrane fusion protein
VVQPTAAAEPERKVLYWQHPDGQADFSRTPKKTADGRDYVAVYEDLEPHSKQAKPVSAAKKGNRKILYYRNPMGLPDTSPVPKKAPWAWTTFPSRRARKTTDRPCA